MTRWGSVAAIAIFLGALGCADDTPRMRLGSLPFPGPRSLWAVADPNDLGMHRSDSFASRTRGIEETGHGIMYTCKAGFIDISHLREYTDWVKYIRDKLLAAWKNGRNTVAWKWDVSDFELRMTWPAWLRDLSPQEREKAVELLCLRAAQRATLITATWHEIGSWYGVETIPFISEAGSAFTWDDTTSHVLATQLAERALTWGPADWNTAVTHALTEMIKELQPVSRECLYEALDRVHGRWYRWGTAVRRDLAIGLAGDVKMPWFVPGLSCCPEPGPPLAVPSLRDVMGHDVRDNVEVRITPPAWLMKEIFAGRGVSEQISGEDQILAILEQMRGEFKAEWGPEADQP